MADEQTQPVPEAAPPIPEPPLQPPAPVQDPQALTDQFKKDELQTVAAAQGVDVPSGATKADIATAIVDAQAPTAQPVTVNNFTRRSDDDALLGSWVDVVSGTHAARFGAYVEDVSHDPQTGYPARIMIRTRDAQNELLEVDYSAVRPSERTGGR